MVTFIMVSIICLEVKYMTIMAQRPESKLVGIISFEDKL